MRRWSGREVCRRRVDIAGRGGASPAEYLTGKPTRTTTDLALRILALAALRQNVSQHAEQLERQTTPDGRIGPLVNSTIWSVIALRAAGRPVPRASVRYL